MRRFPSIPRAPLPWKPGLPWPALTLSSTAFRQKPERYAALIPLVKRYGARVVALSLDDGGMTDDMAKVWEVADALVKRLEDDGVPPDHIFVDP